jgi:hypothetical protein
MQQFVTSMICIYTLVVKSDVKSLICSNRVVGLRLHMYIHFMYLLYCIPSSLSHFFLVGLIGFIDNFKIFLCFCCNFRYMDHTMDIDGALQSCDKSSPVILVAHQPKAARAALQSNYRLDLVLSG